jgi:uncharacterized protein
MKQVNLIITHGFFVFLLLYPVLGALSYRQLFKLDEINEAMRVSFYKQNLSVQLMLVLVVSYIVNPFQSEILAGKQLFQGESLLATVLILIAISIIIWPIPKLKAYVKRSLEELKLILPITKRERFYWVLVSVMAGISEEIIFRLFLIYYFTYIWGFSIVIAIVLATTLFGLAHAYQGWQGILATAYLGGLLGLLYLTTGSILPPIIIHALIDLRILLIWKPDKFKCK